MKIPLKNVWASGSILAHSTLKIVF